MIKTIIKKLANLKLAIFLLLLIAFSSSLGSIVEQDKEIEFYIENYKNLNVFFNFPASTVLLILGLNHIYTTWWFFFLLSLFGLCLISCTFLQQFPALKFARRYYFYRQFNQLHKFDYKFFFKSKNLNRLIFFLKENQYSVYQQKKSLYANKGLISRIGPIVVHISIISILIGSILGSFCGFNAQEFIPKTEIFHIQNIVKNGGLSIIPQRNFRINDFWSTYTEVGRIKQFHSDISVLDGKGSEMLRQTLSVNKPFHYQGLTFYQTDWGFSGLRIKILKKKTENLQLPLSQTFQSNQKVWLSWLPLDTKGIIFIISNNRGQVQLYNENGELFGTLNKNEAFNLTNVGKIKFVDFIVSSGIQIKSDPGIFIIYTGFIFLIFSSLISYISFSEIWIIRNKKEIACGGQTNRAQLKFKIEMISLAQYATKSQSIGK